MNNNSALGAIRRRWWVIIVFALVGAVIGALPEPERVEEQVRTFSATHTLLLNDDPATTSGASAVSAVSPNQVTLFVRTGEVPTRVAEEIGFDGNAASLASQVTSEFDLTSEALTIASTQENPQRAELIADTFADELTSYLVERQDKIHQDRLAAALERLSVLENQLNLVTAELALDPESPTLSAQQGAVSRQYSVAFEQSEELEAFPPVLGFTTLQRAQAVDVTDRGIGAPTGRFSRAILGMLVGAALGAGVALLLGQLDRRLRSREQAEAVMDMRARVTIPKVRDPDRDQIVVATGRHDPLSDSYRTVRNVVGFVMRAPDESSTAPITLVVSPGPGDGKTSLAANLAASMAETGKRTILVNTDFRRPRLASVLGPAAAVPLPFTINDLDHLDARSMLHKTGRNNLLLFDLSTIEGSPGELLRATIDKLPELKALADAVVIDTSPVGVTAEALDLVPFADVIAVIARVGGTQIAAAQRTIAILRDLATAPMILVLSGIKMDKADYYEYTDGRGGDHTDRLRWLRRPKSADATVPAPVMANRPVGASRPTEAYQPERTEVVIEDDFFDTDDLLEANDLFDLGDPGVANGSSEVDGPGRVRAPDVKPAE